MLEPTNPKPCAVIILYAVKHSGYTKTFTLDNVLVKTQAYTRINCVYSYKFGGKITKLLLV